MKLLLHKHWARLDAYAFAQFLSSMGYEITLEGVIKQRNEL